MDSQIDRIRAFNRFYTRRLGALDRALLESPFSLTEARLLFELGQSQSLSPHQLVQELGLDSGHLSRVLRGLREQGLVESRDHPEDGRQQLLSLTASGSIALAGLEERSCRQIAAWLEPLGASERQTLVQSLERAERLLGGRQAGPVLLRALRPGDLGWVVSSHGRLYAAEFGWDASFEALVAEIVARYRRNLDPERECAWIAERDGVPIGSAFVVRAEDRADAAQLRLLLVEPSARGLGLGLRLSEECLAFAQSRGYRRMVLWTNSILTAARRIYQQLGFVLVRSEAHHSFGHDLIGEYWERAL